MHRWLEAMALLAAMSVVGYVVFTHKLVLNEVQIPFTVPLFPFIIWGALRFEQTGAAIVALLISASSLLATVYQAGPFAQQDFYRAVLTVHTYMLVIALSSYSLAAAVTAGRLAEQRSRNLSEELRALSQNLEVAREQERVHLAREIHDQLGQQLTALGLALAAVRRRLPSDNEPALAKTHEMDEILQSTLSTVQRIATELRPGVINELALPDALQWLAENFTQQSSIPVEFQTDIDELPLDPQSKVTVFRIFQEAFANIARHAQATRANLYIRHHRDHCTITLQDDGAGVPPEAKTSHRSLGFIGMRERAHAVGAELRISDAPAFAAPHQRRGTTIEVRLPLNSSNASSKA
jgi:signal transduction histidine kinase